MADPKPAESNNDEFTGVDVDGLLAQVQQMANRVETLITTNNRKGTPPADATPPANAPKSDVPVPETPNPEMEIPEPEAPEPGDITEPPVPADDTLQPSAEKPNEVGLDALDRIASAPAAPAPELANIAPEPPPAEEGIGDHDAAKVAEDEINQVLSGMDTKGTDLDPPSASDAELDNLPLESSGIEALPQFCRSFLKMLMTIDRGFLWMPRPAKDLLGYTGLATLIFVGMVWIIVVVYHQ